jgi:DNA repair exonuclease SbcCD ATPase subunit
MARDETRDTSRVMSYDELAAILGISRESARRHVLRKRWARRKGNDGKVRIEVPADGLPVAGHDARHVSGQVTEHVKGHDTGHDTGPSQALFRIIERLEGEIAELRPKVAEREVLVVRVEALTVALEAEKRRTDELCTERDRSCTHTDRLEGELAELRWKATEHDQLTGQLEALRAMLEQTRQERDAERQKAAEHDVLVVQVEALKAALEESRRERDRWVTTAHALTHPPVPHVPPVVERRGLLGWLRRAG